MIKVNNFDKALSLANKIADDLNKEENVATYTVQVEKWAKEHPAKTRQSEFLKMFPDSELDSNGIIDICPIVMYHKYTCSGLITCDECRAEFWKEEIE